MPIFYCHICSVKMKGNLENLPGEILIGSKPIPLDRYVKHTAPIDNKIYPLNSIFINPEFNQYRNYMVYTSASGCLEIDENGRESYIYFAGKTIGYTYSHGKYVRPDDAIRLVINDNGVHIMPTSGSFLSSATCACCGCPIPKTDLPEDAGLANTE